MEQIILPDDYYLRHHQLAGFGRKAQDSMSRASVLIIGMGGLGCPAATYLAAAGIGRLVLCDDDTVSVSNLHRQVLYRAGDVGKSKVVVAAKALQQLNPLIQIETRGQRLLPEELKKEVQAADLVLDATDNFDTKYLVDEICGGVDRPLVFAAVGEWQGQVSVFHCPDADGERFSYADLYPVRPTPGLSQNCAQAGVLGILPGLVGCFQAAEAIKVLTGVGTPLTGRLLLVEPLAGSAKLLRIAKRSGRVRGVVDGSSAEKAPIELQDEAFFAALKSDESNLLLDVRSSEEHKEDSIGGKCIPLKDLATRFLELTSHNSIFVYCKSGTRSARAVNFIRLALPELASFSLKGGIDGLKTRSDPEVQRHAGRDFET